MPYSDAGAKLILLDHVKKYGMPRTILDIGMGAGQYGKHFFDIDPTINMIGIEIFEPYITKKWEWAALYDIHQIYKKIHIADMRTFDYSTVDADLVIAGDVLEHVQKHEAIEVVRKLKEKYDWILVVLPIYFFFEQGPNNGYGNIYEAHLHQWTKEEGINDLDLAYVCDAGCCGLYEWRKTK